MVVESPRGHLPQAPLLTISCLIRLQLFLWEFRVHEFRIWAFRGCESRLGWTTDCALTYCGFSSEFAESYSGAWGLGFRARVDTALAGDSLPKYEPQRADSTFRA